MRLCAPRRYGGFGDPGGAAADAGVGALHAAGDFLVEEIRPDPAGEAAEVAELHAVTFFLHASGMIGDSRAYILRKNAISQITKDQSYVEMLVDAGLITREQAQKHPQQNVILQAMVHRPEVTVALGRLELRKRRRRCCVPTDCRRRLRMRKRSRSTMIVKVSIGVRASHRARERAGRREQYYRGARADNRHGAHSAATW